MGNSQRQADRVATPRVASAQAVPSGCARLAGLLLVAGLAGPVADAQPAAGSPEAPSAGTQRASEPASGVLPPRQLEWTNPCWTGDFEQMLQRRRIRIAVPYGRSMYVIDEGRERGFAAELVRDFERWLNQRYAKRLDRRPLTVFIVATPRDRLLTDLRRGRVDIATGGLSATPERLKSVDIVAPDAELVSAEVLVTGPASPAIARLTDLAGKTVHARRGSSPYASLVELNRQLRRQRLAPMRLVPVAPSLDDDQLLDLVDAGLIQALVVDDWKARIWAAALPRLKLHEDLVLRAAAPQGWAIRRHSPQLEAVLRDFYDDWVKGSGVVPHRIEQLMRVVDPPDDPTEGEAHRRFTQAIGLFETYGHRYRFDPLLLAALGYQESKLDQRRVSRAGAVGVMQVMPATGRSLRVGDIRQLEPNIHAGAKYLDQLLERNLPDLDADEVQRTLFALASYNAGPGTIARMRREAAKRGLDPNRWFDNVERVVADKVGLQTTSYVRNVYKYYVSYRLAEQARERSQRLRERVIPAPR